jgi:hypothetical protein
VVLRCYWSIVRSTESDALSERESIRADAGVEELDLEGASKAIPLWRGLPDEGQKTSAEQQPGGKRSRRSQTICQKQK